MKTAYLIIGAIGSGKSAIADFILSDTALSTVEYVGSDIYKRKFFDKEPADIKRGYRCADELAFYRLEKILKTGCDFAYELCPTNSNKIETIKYLVQKYEYTVLSFFVGTEGKDVNIGRCSKREGEGADHVPNEKIESRYDRALGRALEMAQMSAKIYFVDNSLDVPRMVASISENVIAVYDGNCGWFKEHVQQKLV